MRNRKVHVQPKYGKALGILILGLFAISVIGHGVLFTNERLRDFAYRELSYTYLAHRITNATDAAAIAQAITAFANAQLHFEPNIPLIDDTPWDVLSRGRGFCDQYVYLTAALLEKQGIASQFTVLRNDSGSEPHTVVEARIGERWQVYDPFRGYVLRLPDGQAPTFQELCDDPEIILQNQRVIASGEFTDYDYRKFAKLYCIPPRVLPVYGMQRSGLRSLVSRFVEVHFRLFGAAYATRFQDLFLSVERRGLPPEEQAYRSARQHQLYGRDAEALREYATLIAQYPESAQFGEALLFAGSMHCAQGDVRTGITLLLQAAARAPEGWEFAIRSQLAKCYERAGEIDTAMRYYRESAHIKSLDSAERLRQLREGSPAIADETLP